MSTIARARYVPTPYQDAPEAGRIILRDGTTAQLRVAQLTDQAALWSFFNNLSREAKQRRFFSATTPRQELIASLCDCTNPRSTLTLLVIRLRDGKPQIIATGSYLARGDGTAEIAFAVDDLYRGKGLGTILLERLALLAVRHGLTRFWAVTHYDNQEMRDVFRQSGFKIEERLEGGHVEVDLSVIPSEQSTARLDMRDRIATVASLRPFFWPKSVALVGASREPTSIGFRILGALVTNRFQGPVYPVNPKATVVGCIRAYPSMRDLPEPVDLAIIAVPRDAVPAVVDDCAVRGVRALVVITAGYAETDAAGKELQARLLEKVRGYGMRMIGPNCMGLLNTDPTVRLNASFAPVFPPAGRVAMSSQSGALGLAILAAAQRFQLGLSTFVSVGNKADVSGNDLLQYWEEDMGTDVILLYLESFGNPRRFARIARRISLQKPIVAIKSGRTQVGSRAAGSHTAALAANDAVVDALFRQTGVIRAETLEEMFDLAALLGRQPLPAGRRTAVVTNAGGPGILCADTCEAGGLILPELSDDLKERLRAFLPAAASVGNPVDMIASAPPEHYRRTVATLLASDEVDALIVLYIPVGLVESEAVNAAIAQGVAEARATGGERKPVLACLMSEQSLRSQITVKPPLLEREAGKGTDHEERIPTYAFPEGAARVLAKAAEYATWRSRPQGMIPDFDNIDIPAVQAICRRALAERDGGWLTAAETRTVLEAMGLPLAAGGVAATADEAAELAQRIGFPAAVKLASRTLVHKTEVGGVRLNLADADAVRTAFHDMQARLRERGLANQMEGVLVQQMITGGVEVMAGVTDDPLFGPVLAFGLGGIHVEVLADVAFRVTPLTDRDSAEMVRSIRGFRLLQGYRGHPPGDVDALQELLLRLSRLVEDVLEVGELDLNPIIALPPGQGCRIVDARIQVRKPHGAAD